MKFIYIKNSFNNYKFSFQSSFNRIILEILIQCLIFKKTLTKLHFLISFQSIHYNTQICIIYILIHKYYFKRITFESFM